MAPIARGVWRGRYEPLAILGQGGYGVVYEARDEMTGQLVALKELSHVSATSVARFKQEFRAVQEVHHPNLVRLDHLLEDNGTWAIAMELVPGDDLLTRIYAEDSPLGFHEAPLRDAFLQLAEGLSALHAASLLHRDLKPSNVRVTAAGRVVLLDFGLTTTLDDKNHYDSQTLGTVAYMAPEQMLGQKLGPATDWYAFGVCLYEALTGVRPFDGPSAHELLEAKLHAVPDEPSVLARGIPADLAALSLALLAVSPDERPSGEAIRSVLAPAALRQPAPASAQSHSGAASVRARSGAPANTNASAFEGREPELAQLMAAWQRTVAGAHEIVLIEGESGIGKSSLCDHFLRTVARNHEPVHVLRSRCYENELLAYKAFDGALDELVRVLERLPESELAAILPPRAALLCRLFPALGAFAQLSELPLSGVAAAPAAQRLEAFSIFRRLLARLSESRPLVLAIDDLQWADPESFRLLQAVLGGPQPVRCLVVATVRPAAELDSEAAENLALLRGTGRVSELSLLGLARPHALRLARELLPAGLPEAWVESVVEESAGHPLFLTVLARFLQSHTPRAPKELTLDAAIAAQLGALAGAARRLVETVAVAGAPLAASICRQAAGLTESETGPMLAELCGQKLLRRRNAGEIACFHDRIRRVVVGQLEPTRARALHAQLAQALTAHSHIDPAVLARHHEAAGEDALAHRHYRQAAERAQTSLAFARAAALYARALGLSRTLGRPDAEHSTLLGARAHAFACSGRSEEAAQEYLQAAVLARGEERTRLRLLAAQHLLQSAQIEAGMEAAHDLLAELGARLPTTMPGAIARLLWDRAALSWTGLTIPRTPAPLDARARMLLSALWGLSKPVGWAAPVASMPINTRLLRLARAHGEPSHMAHALGEEAFARAMQHGERSNAGALLARARELCAAHPSPSLEVSLAFREGSIATVYWKLQHARERLEHAERVCNEQCPDEPWLLTNVRTMLGSVLANLGEHSALADRTAGWLAEARDRNDRFAVAAIEGLGYGSYRHLMLDRPDEAAQSLAAALEPWPLEPFTFARLGELIGSTFIALYRGGDQATRWFDQERPRLARALLLKLRATRVPLRVLQASACLSAYTIASGAEARRLLRHARKLTRGVERDHSTLGTISRLGLEAQLAALDRDFPAALAIIQRLRELPSSQENAMTLALYDCLEGKLEGGDAGAAKLRSGLAFFSEQGWRVPERAIGLIWPAFPSIVG